ncbi:hypothetical protein D3C84_929960 [compost metagenome]
MAQGINWVGAFLALMSKWLMNGQLMSALTASYSGYTSLLLAVGGFQNIWPLR